MRLVLLAAAALVVAVPALAQTPTPGAVVVNEIQYDPPAPQASTNEWVEVANRSAAAVDLQGLVLSDGPNASDAIAESVPLAPGELITLVRNETEFQAAYPGVAYVVVAGFPALNNTGDTPQLLDGTTVIDAVPYEPSWGGTDASLERIDVDGPSDQASNFATTTDPSGGTPGATNTATGGGGDTTPPDLTGATATNETTVVATFSEALAASAETTSRYVIDGGIGSPSAVALSGATVTLTLAAALTPGQTYTLTATDIADLAGNVLASDSESFLGVGDGDPTRELVLNEFLYDPPAAQPAGEYVELFNRSASTVDLAQYTLNDATGDDEPITDVQTLVAPGEYAVVVQDGAAFSAVFPDVAFVEQPSWSALNNTGDDIVLRRLDGTLVDRLSYTPGVWGGSDVAVERISAEGPSDDPANWAEAAGTLGTPGALNTASGGTGGDTTPPDLISATPTSATTLVAEFSEALNASSAETLANYSVDGGIGAPVAASLMPTSEVELTFATAFTSGQGYLLTVTGVEDTSGNAIVSDSEGFTYVQTDTPDPRDLVLNEFLYDPPADQDAGEYIELFNRSTKTFDLAQFLLNDSTGDPTPISTVSSPVSPGEYAVVVQDGARFSAVFPGVPFVEQPSWSALNNTGDQILLTFQDGREIDALSYTPAEWGGSDVAVERRDPDGPSNVPANWGEAEGVLGTPGAINSVFGPDTVGPELVSASADQTGTLVTVVLSEPVDPASLDGAFAVSGASVESVSYEPNATEAVLTLGAPLATGTVSVTATGLVDLVGNETATSTTTFDFVGDDTPPGIASASAPTASTVVVVFSEPVTVASAENASTYAVAGAAPASVELERDGETALSATLTLGAPLSEAGTYTVTATGLVDLAGNIGDGTASFFFGQGDVPAPRDLVINEFLYDPPSAQDAGEYVELFNRSAKTFDLREFTLQDATETADPVTTVAVFVGPGEYVVIVDNPDKFAAVFPGVPFVEQPSWNTLNNATDSIRLKYQGALVDSLTYVPAVWGGSDVALERRDPDGPSSSPANWGEAAGVLGTPGAINSVFGPDEAGPRLLSAAADRAGTTVTVQLDEPVDPASVAGAFAVTNAEVASVDYAEGEQVVLLTLAAPLPTGTVTVTATNLRDELGNVTPTSAVQFEFVRDETPPTLASAFISSEISVEVRFTEAVARESAESVGTYDIEGLGLPASVSAVSGPGGVVGATLLYKAPFEAQRLYTLTVSGLVDLAGNVQTEPATAALFFGTPDVPGPGELVLNEIQYDPLVGSAGEYVELFNPTADRVFDLSVLSLDGGEPDGDPVTETTAPVAPGGYVAIVRDGEAFAAAFPGAPFVVADNVQSLSNSGAPLVLRDLGGAVVDSVRYDPDWHRVELDDATGISLERRDPAGPSSDASNWSSSLAELGGTPGAVNSVSVLAGETPGSAGLEITSPFAPDEGESARIAYVLESEAALVRARIYDGGGRLVRELASGRFGGATGSLSWDGRDDRGERLRIGIYIVLLDAVDAQGGTTESFRDVVVLARR